MGLKPGDEFEIKLAKHIHLIQLDSNKKMEA